MTDLTHDLRYAWRTLRRNPLFATIVVLTLGLGIGANTAIFSLIDQLLLRRLPVSDPDRLVILHTPGRNRGFFQSSSETVFPMSHPMFVDFRDRGEAVSGVAARYPTTLNVTWGEDTERAQAELVSGTYFEVLGVRPGLGRLLGPEDDVTPGAHPVVVLSHSYWMRRLAGDPAVVGRRLDVNGTPMTVVGVSSPGFRGFDTSQPTDLMLPIMMKTAATPTWDKLDERRALWLQVFARLMPGTTREQAETALGVLYHQILEQEVAEMGQVSDDFRQEFLAKRLQLLPGWQGLPDVKERLSTPLLVLMGMVGLVLLIACANVANLLIARASSRQKEIAVRLALGAGRLRLVRQLVVESLLLAVIGGGVGLIVSGWATAGLVQALPFDGAVETLSVDPDWRLAGFAFALASFTGLVFGLVPALQATRPALAPTLKDQSAAGGAPAPLRLRKALVVAQVALSMLLLVGAGLFTRSLHNLRSLDPGFEADRLVEFGVDPALSGYDLQGKRALYGRLRDEIAALPGVLGVSLAQEPLMADSHWLSTVQAEGYESKEGEDMSPNFNAVGPGFFETLGLSLLAGRGFDERDTSDAAQVAVVNETFARYFFGDESPIGKHFGFNRGTPYDIEIVGVVRDGQINSLRETPVRFAYLPYTQSPDAPGTTFYVRTGLDVAALAGPLRDAVKRVDPDLPLYDLRTMQAQIDQSLFVDRIVAGLSAAFGALATLLAALGLYGVMSYAVTRRTREIGVRVALGADRVRILRLVLSEVVLLAGIGMALGLPGGWGLGHLAESQLYGLEASDPVTLGLACVVLATSALLAGLVPAARAARMDPSNALRYE